MADVIDRFRRNGGVIEIDSGRVLSFEDFCDFSIIMRLLCDGLVVRKKKGFWGRIFSSKETYTYIGDSGVGRVYSEIDPYGEEIWNV